ncbi:hypothetical protein ACH5RR_040459, partial [Cinchona calisaya]
KQIWPGANVQGNVVGKPTIIVTTAETCRKFLTDDHRFRPGWPKSVSDLLRKRGLHGVTIQEHKRLRQLIAAPVGGLEALSLFIGYIEDIARTSFDKWEKMDKPIEFLTEMRKTAFKGMMNIIMGNEINDEKLLDYMEKEYTAISNGLKSIAINLPGFAFHRTLKDQNIKVGSLVTFGAGSRLCPGADLDKLEIAV